MNTEEQIEPIPVKRGKHRVHTSHKGRPGLGRLLLLLILFLLVGLTLFVFSARRVELQLEPTADRVMMVGRIPAIPIPDGFFALPGSYTLMAEKAGYFSMEETIQVTRQPRDQIFTLPFVELPGTISLRIEPVEKAEVFWRGEAKGSWPLEAFEAGRGEALLEVRAKDYLPWSSNVVVKGRGEAQAFNAVLTPAWSEIELLTTPDGASVRLDGNLLGKTPLSSELFQGSYGLEFERIGFESVRTQIVVEANSPRTVGPVKLFPAYGEVSITSDPAGAYIQVNDEYAGQTPKTLRLKPGEQHEVLLLKTGYKKLGKLFEPRPGEKAQWDAALEPEAARILVKSNPEGAEVIIDGDVRGVTPVELVVPAIRQTLLLRKNGYAPVEETIEPKLGPVSRISIRLTPLSAGTGAAVAAAPSVTAANGMALNLMPLGNYSMGSSRREQGRRSNETLLNIELTRPFYLGLYEVTNEQFLEFNPKHASGYFKSKKLSGLSQPVVQVTWAQAAQFCNWLSEREGLPTVYVRENDTWLARDPVPAGYRLPTEAEWEFSARYFNNKAALKYPWGPSWPPTSGNYADLTAQFTLDRFLKAYKDGYSVSAPAGKGRPNALGLFDLDGNVSEWCHDIYQIYTATAAGAVYRDPVGPKTGRHHVVRGGSWMHYQISHLRNSYRGYEDKSKPDIGFRVARYVE